VPTGWYPTSVAVSKDGALWYIVNAKHEPGAQSLACPIDSVQRFCPGDNNEEWQLEKAGFLTMPAPSALELARLTRQVARNDHFGAPDNTVSDQRIFSFLREHIRHVIYIIKENRTYDQVFGDLEIGNGDPHLALFPENLSPNHHALARNFVTLDNFLVTGEGSDTGWDWSVSARTNDFTERTSPVSSAGKGLEYNQEGANRNINVGLAPAANAMRSSQSLPQIRTSCRARATQPSPTVLAARPARATSGMQPCALAAPSATGVSLATSMVLKTPSRDCLWYVIRTMQK